MNHVFRTPSNTPGIDLRLLLPRDRAVLRILDRAEAATARQLAILAYGHRRVAQRRLAALWRTGLLERTVLPPAPRGGAEYAYRLSTDARRRLGDRSPRPRGSNRLGHTLDIVDTVCSLVSGNGDPRASSPVALWLTEATAYSQFGGPPYPDSVVVLVDGELRGVLCLEIDEATQRRSAIEAKLNGYRRLVDRAQRWRVLFVVPSPTRARWLRLVAASVAEGVATRTWVTTLQALRASGLDAGVVCIGRSDTRSTVRGLLTPGASPGSFFPVGSQAWLRLLGEGGVEDVDAILGALSDRGA